MKMNCFLLLVKISEMNFCWLVVEMWESITSWGGDEDKEELKEKKD